MICLTTYSSGQVIAADLGLAERKGKNMIPGPIVIRRCSACTGRILDDTTDSGNTFGARFWTDGKMHAPMLPDRPLLVKCPYCGALLWIEEQEQVGEIDLWISVPLIRLGPNEQVEEVELGNCDDDPFKDTRSYIITTPQDYFVILQKGISDKQKERYIRLRVWWAGNDARRQGEDTPLSDDEIANLRAFAAMLDESDENDLIMKAETMRELGKYEEATVILSKPFSEKLAETAAIIKSLAESHIPFVREMTFR